MKQPHVPLVLFAGVLYAGLVFIVPGFWVLRHAAIFLQSHVGILPLHVVLFLLHAGVYGGLIGALSAFVRANKEFFQDDARPPVWLEKVLEISSLRGYVMFNYLALALLTLAFLGMFQFGSSSLESMFLFFPVFLSLLDLRVHPVPVRWEDRLPPPRIAPDSVPALEGESAGKKITLTWNPWLWSEENRPWISRDFLVLEADKEEAAAKARTKELLEYLVNGCCPSVVRVASSLREISEVEGFTMFEELASTVALVRSVPYATDEETHGVPDYFDYPVELLWDERGDCEDHAILAAAILDILGHPVGLFDLEMEDAGHVALAYQTTLGTGMFSRNGPDGCEYFYVETVPTNSEQGIGDLEGDFFAKLQDARVLVPQNSRRISS